MNDKEGRKWLLQKLYESKYRYIYRANNHKLYVTISKPVTVDGVYFEDEIIYKVVNGKAVKIGKSI